MSDNRDWNVHSGTEQLNSSCIDDNTPSRMLDMGQQIPNTAEEILTSSGKSHFQRLRASVLTKPVAEEVHASDHTKVATIYQPQSCSLEDRLSNIVLNISALGFDSFEAMIVAYYTTKFRDDSEMSFRQRLSRKRYLRSLIATIHQSSKWWQHDESTEWEDEITRMAESIYTSELRTAHCSRDCLRPDLNNNRLDVELSEHTRSRLIPSCQVSYHTATSQQGFWRKDRLMLYRLRGLKLYSLI